MNLKILTVDAMKPKWLTAVAVAACLALPASASADGVVHTLQPLDNDLSQCFGESVTLTGALFFRDLSVTNGGGGTVDADGYIWLQVTGIGTETGLEYRFVGDSNTTHVTNGGLQVLTATGTFKQITIGGQTADFTIRTVFHFTVDANGVSRVFFEKGGFTCS
jgi:hypothetical protein